MRAVRTAAFVLAALALAAIRPAGAAFVTFESAPVRPLALAPDGSRLFAANTPDGRLEIFDVTADGLRHAGAVAVGLEPVAVAARTRDEVWVVNHLSDSVSVVRLDGVPRVVRTLLVGDEPRDVVFAGGRAFVTAAHRGQNHPAPTSPTEPGVGRADVWVFDTASAATAPLQIVTLFGDTPRALAVAPDGSAVYAAIFRSGNQTTTVPEGAVCDGGPDAPPCALGELTMPGGLPGPRTNLAGVPGPETGLIVAFDRASAHWLDPLGRIWDDAVRFTLPDRDVFRIDARTLAVTAEWAHVGTVLYGMVANPVTGAVYVVNTEARNDVRFEGGGALGTTTVRGHMHESRVTILRDGAPALARRLNPHIDYAVVPSPPDVVARSVALPNAVAIDAAGTTLWIAAFGSGVLAAVDTTALEAGTFTPDVADHVALSGGGPSGVVLDEPRGRLYALTRFDNAVSVVDLATRRETAHLPLFDAEPAGVVAGRPLLYDARATSGNGENACASCHVGADVDDLAWDLGDPDALALPNPNPIHFGEPQAFHPLKGPMTTQTLRGMARNGPMHWRGDRTGGVAEDGDPFDAVLALDTFNVAFDSLLGLGRPMELDGMRRLSDFVLQIVPPPNPYRALDGSLGPDEQAGRDLFVGRPTDQAGFNCVGCHTLSPRDGAFGADGQSALQGGPQLMKIPHLRNLYTKIGMFGVAPIAQLGGGDATPLGPQIRGFGFTHDGSVDTIARFLGGTSFTLSDVEHRQLEAFLLAFDSDLAPIVGQQVTLPAGGAARWDLLRARADAGECDLVARGVAGGEARGWLGVARGLFVSDRRADAPLDDAALRALATAAGQELTLTCVPPGSGPRMAIDRDEDGFLDRDELDAGTDPADAASRPDGDPLPLTRIPIRTSTLALRGATPVKAMTFAAKTKKDAAAHRIVPPPAGGAFDPTRHGAVLHVYNAGFTSDVAIVELPASGWRRAGSAKRPKGYRFRGAGRRVLLGPDLLKVGLRGLAAYSLDEPAQGRVAIRLASGLLIDGGWCASAPAKPRGRQQSTAKSDRPGRFLAKPQSPPPDACPPEP